MPVVLLPLAAHEILVSALRRTACPSADISATTRIIKAHFSGDLDIDMIPVGLLLRIVRVKVDKEAFGLWKVEALGSLRHHRGRARNAAAALEECDSEMGSAHVHPSRSAPLAPPSPSLRWCTRA